MQLSIATLTAIVVTLANAAPISPADQIAAIVDGKPVPQHPAHHEVNKDNSKDVVDLLGHAQLVDGDGLNVLGGKANGGISKRQELERLYPEHYGSVESSKDNSKDILDVLGHAKLLNGNAINLLGGKADGGISKRQELERLYPEYYGSVESSKDNSKDVVDVLGHVQALNNDGINLLGHSANGGIGKRGYPEQEYSKDNSKDVVDALGHVQALNNDGLNILGGKANGGIGRRQVKSDNSADVVDALGHVQALNNDGINALGHSANGGIGKRGYPEQEYSKDNSKDVVDALGHLQLLNNNGLNVLGGSANGGIGRRQVKSDNSEDVADVLGHAKLLSNDGINVLGGSANGGAAHKPEPKPVVIKEKEQHQPEHQPEPDHVSIVGPSFEANQIQQVRQQNHQ